MTFFACGGKARSHHKERGVGIARYRYLAMRSAL
jgi:hypothetical protein